MLDEKVDEKVTGVRISDGLRFGATVLAAVWTGWALLGLVGVTIVPASNPVPVPGIQADPTEGGWHNLFYAGDRADSLWYERIAGTGYSRQDGSAAFFPLYPLAIRLLTVLTGLDWSTSAIVVAQLCFLGALVLMFAITAREFGRDTARRATIYLAAFPTAFFFLVPYTEAPFLLLVLLTFWYARGDRWQWAILPAIGAGLTRSAGVVLCAALAIEAFVQWRAGKPLYPRLAVACAPALGTAAYFAYWAVRGDLLAPVRAQQNWGRHWRFPLRTLWEAVIQGFAWKSYWMIDLLVVGFVVVVVLWALRTVPWSWSAYAVGSLLLPLSNAFPDRLLMSAPRFTTVIFPVFVMLAIAAGRKRQRIPHSLIVGAFAAGWSFLGLLYLNGYHIF